MVLAPLQKLKIKYELSYQSTTRLKYTDTFDHNDEESYYILKTNNPVYLEPLYSNAFYAI
jgi:hypothetical protein